MLARGKQETQEGYEEVLVPSHIRAGFRPKHKLATAVSSAALQLQPHLPQLTTGVHLVAQAHFPSAGVTGMPHQFWFCVVWELNLGL